MRKYAVKVISQFVVECPFCKSPVNWNKPLHKCLVCGVGYTIEYHREGNKVLFDDQLVIETFRSAPKPKRKE